MGPPKAKERQTHVWFYLDQWLQRRIVFNHFGQYNIGLICIIGKITMFTEKNTENILNNSLNYSYSFNVG